MKTFTDQGFKLRNPANAQTLTWINPAITASQNHYMREPYYYIIFKEGSTYYCQNGITQGVEISGSEPGPVFHYAIVNGSGLGKILVKSGTYTFNTVGSGSKPSQVLTLYNNTHIEGEGMFNTILITGSAMSAKNFWDNDDATLGNSNIILKNFKSDHTLAANKNNFALHNVTNMIVEHLYCKNGADGHFNFFITGHRDAGGLPDMWVDNFLMDNCILESHINADDDNFSGGLIRNSCISNTIFGPSHGSAGMANRLMYDTTVANCVSYSSGAAGFNMESGQRNIFVNCLAHDCAEAGFKNFHIDTGGPPVDGFPIGMQYVGCSARNCRRGFQLEGHYNSITGCKIYNNSSSGIEIGPGDYAHISGNMIYNNGSDTLLADDFRWV